MEIGEYNATDAATVAGDVGTVSAGYGAGDTWRFADSQAYAGVQNSEDSGTSETQGDGEQVSWRGSSSREGPRKEVTDRERVAVLRAVLREIVTYAEQAEGNETLAPESILRIGRPALQDTGFPE